MLDNKKYKKILQYLAVLAMAAVFYLVLVLIYKQLGLPSPEAVVAWATKYYERYGYWVVLVGALAEGTLFINWYLPGSIVVALGAVFARASGMNIFLMLLMVIIGFYSTALLNYAFIPILLWNIFWTIIFYYFGVVLLKHVYLVSVVAAVFIYFMFMKSFKKQSEIPINVP